MSEFEVHSTLVNTSGLPSGVINHGIVTPQQYQDLLAKTKVSDKTLILWAATRGSVTEWIARRITSSSLFKSH